MAPFTVPTTALRGAAMIATQIMQQSWDTNFDT